MRSHKKDERVLLQFDSYYQLSICKLCIIDLITQVTPAPDSEKYSDDSVLVRILYSSV